MTDSISNSKRVAKNTLFLYFRMFLTMVISFFTSRVVLEVLGIEDYGIYNIVGGLVVLFTFLNNALVNATQRYLNLAVGKGDFEEQQQVFSASIKLYVYLSVVLFIALETVGLWFLNCELNIPFGKYMEANVIFQISVANMIVGLFRIPYNAYILAYEKMSFYAYMSIIESVLKLVVVYLLVVLPFPKLIMYAFLYFIVGIFLNISYVIYCNKKLHRIYFNTRCEKSIFKEVLHFSGWMTVAGIADMGYMQGLNIIINIFFGVLYNATMGITNNLKNAVFSFVRNMMVAAQPQIMKSYAAGEYAYFKKLTFSVSKCAFFLFFIMAVPLILNMDFVLTVWLGKYPPDTEIFCSLCMIFCMFDSLVSPLWTAAQIKGDIKNYQIITGIIVLMNVPFSYLVLKLGCPPYYIFVVQIVLAIIGLVYRVAYLDRQGILNAWDYFKSVAVRVSFVALVATPILLLVASFYDGLERFLITLPLSIVVIGICSFCIGLNSRERFRISEFVVKRIRKVIT